MDIHSVKAVFRKTLFSGLANRDYCAFPSLAETALGMLCMFKLGNAHARDGGAIAYMLFDKSGNVSQSGIAAEPKPGFTLQNVELLRFPDGSLRYFIDIQSAADDDRRLGMISGIVTEGPVLGFQTGSDLFTDTQGLIYGYSFDGCPVPGGYIMAAMTFPEFSCPGACKTPILLFSPNGEQWSPRFRLNDRLQGTYNETGICPWGEYLYFVSRSYQDHAAFGRCDLQGNLLDVGYITLQADGINQIARPSLFVRDGGLYCLCRGYPRKQAPMELRLLRLDTDSLTVTRQWLLDTGTGDGYYAEGFFCDGEFRVITYKSAAAGENPSIVMLGYDWAGIA